MHTADSCSHRESLKRRADRQKQTDVQAQLQNNAKLNTLACDKWLFHCYWQIEKRMRFCKIFKNHCGPTVTPREFSQANNDLLLKKIEKQKVQNWPILAKNTELNTDILNWFACAVPFSAQSSWRDIFPSLSSTEAEFVADAWIDYLSMVSDTYRVTSRKIPNILGVNLKCMRAWISPKWREDSGHSLW